MSVTASDSASLGPFEAARSLSYRAPLPRFLRIRQTFGDQHPTYTAAPLATRRPAWSRGHSGCSSTA